MCGAFSPAWREACQDSCPGTRAAGRTPTPEEAMALAGGLRADAEAESAMLGCGVCGDFNVWREACGNSLSDGCPRTRAAGRTPTPEEAKAIMRRLRAMSPGHRGWR